MTLLIDGYNVLYTVGLVGIGIGPGDLHRARLALLNFLTESLEPSDIARTTVVFDANDAPWGLPRAMTHRGLQVRFAAEHESADDLIEELIKVDASPRRLTVVSSDHHIQRAARRRKARAVDSDVWYADLLRSREQRRRSAAVTPARPPIPLLAEDVNYWVRQFGGESALGAFVDQELGKTIPPNDSIADNAQLPSPANGRGAGGEGGSISQCEAIVNDSEGGAQKQTRSSKATKSSSSSKPKKQTPLQKAARKRRRRVEPPVDKPRPTDIEDLNNPFPPGYGEDLLREL